MRCGPLKHIKTLSSPTKGNQLVVTLLCVCNRLLNVRHGRYYQGTLKEEEVVGKSPH